MNDAMNPSNETIEESYDSEAIEECEADQKFNAINRLNELGNLAVSLKLIGGHGFHRGDYELLRDGKFLLMTPTEAQTYLEELIATTEG
jgi:hypothetical protein